jgi:hypothetical protein
MHWRFDATTGTYHLAQGHWKALVWQDTEGDWQAFVGDGPASAFLATSPTAERAQAWAEAKILKLDQGGGHQERALGE